jgi:hypothetical protein
MVYRIEANLAASNVLAAEPGLRKRVEEVLTGILETADEIRLLGEHDFAGIASHPMRVRVADCLVWYVLDLQRLSARVLVVERTSGRADELERSFPDLE